LTSADVHRTCLESAQFSKTTVASWLTVNDLAAAARRQKVRAKLTEMGSLPQRG